MKSSYVTITTSDKDLEKIPSFKERIFLKEAIIIGYYKIIHHVFASQLKNSFNKTMNYWSGDQFKAKGPV